MVCQAEYCQKLTVFCLGAFSVGDETRKGPLRIAVADNLMEYLTFLSETTTFGKSENDVAEHVLAEALEEMRTGRYPFKFSKK